MAILFRHPDTGRIINRIEWEKLLIDGRVELTTRQQGSKYYRKKGKVQTKKKVRRLIATEVHIETKPTFTTEKITVEVEGHDRDFFLVYHNKEERQAIIEKLMDDYNFKKFKKTGKPRKKHINLVTFIEQNS